MRFVAIKMVRVRLNNAAILNEQQARSLGGHTGDKRFSIVKGSAEPGQNADRINRFRRVLSAFHSAVEQRTGRCGESRR